MDILFMVLYWDELILFIFIFLLFYLRFYIYYFWIGILIDSIIKIYVN